MLSMSTVLGSAGGALSTKLKLFRMLPVLTPRRHEYRSESYGDAIRWVHALREYTSRTDHGTQKVCDLLLHVIFLR